jgi:hypothetical protein
VYSAFVLFCVYVAALRRADPLTKESYRLSIDQETDKGAKAQKRAVEPQMGRWMDINKRTIDINFNLIKVGM